MVSLEAPSSSVPPLRVTAPLSARMLLASILSTPPETVVPPVYVLVPESVTVPAPVFVRVPEPARIAEIVPLWTT